MRLTRKALLPAAGLLLYLGLAAVLFFTNPLIQPQGFTLACLLPFMLLAWKVLLLPGHPDYLKKYRTRGRCIALGGISVYSSLAAFGHRLLAMEEARMHIEWDDALYLLLGALWFLPLLLLFLYGMEWLSHRPVRPELKPLARWKAWLITFAALMAVQGVLLYSFAPGGYGNDGVYEYMQAVGTIQLNDWHPIINALMERLLLSVFNSPVFITLVQMAVYAAIVTEFLLLARDCGLRTGGLILLGCLFLLVPSQAMNSISVTKDMPYLYALLGVTLLLLKLLRDPEYFRRVRFWVGMAACLFFMTAYRHNGIMPAAVIIIVCGVLFLKRWKKKQRQAWKLLLGPVIGVLLIGVWKGPVNKATEAVPNTSSTYVTMLCAAASCVNQDLPLSLEAHQIMEEVMPLSVWKQYYSRYEGHDQYMWVSEFGFDTSSITAVKAFRVYLEALARYPDVILKDRLDGMDILWDIRQPETSFNMRYFDYVDGSFEVETAMDLSDMELESGRYYSHRGLADLYRKISLYRGSNGIVDMVLWRSGIYVILLMVLLVFWQANGLNRLHLAAVPLWGNLACSLLAVYHQSFRYVYFIQVYAVALCLITVALMKKKSAEGVSEA